MANQTTVDTAPLLAMPTSRPSLDQVIQVIGGERSGEFAPAYMPEYAGLRGIPAQAMVMPTQFAAMPQFAAPVQQAPAPVQQAPAPATQPAGRTFTPFVVPERKAVTAPQQDIYAGKPAITSAPVIGFTASGDPIYANVPEVKDKSGAPFGGQKSLNLTAKDLEPSYLKNPIIGYTQNGLPIYSSADLGYVQRQPDYGNKEGGLISLAKGGSIAQEAKGLAALGRGGDTMLVHMSPEEVSGLRALALQNGTDLTINPDTGLPEALKLKKILRTLAPVLPFVIPGAGALLGGLAGQALAAGVIGGFTAPGKGFNFQQGLKTGLMAYGLGSLQQSMAAQAGTSGATAGTAGTGGTAAGASADVGATMGGGVGETAAVSSASTPVVGVDNVAFGNPSAYTYYGAPTAAAPTTPVLTDPIAASPPPEAFGAGPGATASDVGVGGGQAGVPDSTLVSDPSGAATPPIQGAPAATVDASGKPVKEATGFEKATGISPTTALVGGSMLLSASQASKEMDLYKQQAAAEAADRERKRREGEEAFARSLGQVPTYRVAGGGLIALARGGMPTFEYGGTTAQTGEPRMVKGAGDGMSDNVPANIEGVQEARLANDEFVVPADVVADIGNGSSSAGAKKLYAMMDRIRNARHGTTEQPPEIDAERYMPA